MKFYAKNEIPSFMAKLSVDGKPHEVNVDHKELTVLLFEKDGVTYAIASDLEHFEAIEFAVLVALVIASAISLLLSLLFSFGVVNRAISPLKIMAQKVLSGSLSNDDVAEFQDEIGVLAKAINERDTALNEFISREKLFTGDVSHELRTPLTIILGASEVLQAKLSTDAQTIEYVERIRNTAEDTSERITALLLLSRAPNRMNASQTVLAPIIDKEVERYQYLLKNKPIKCEVSLDEKVSAFIRPELAGIAFGNLIRNACQYTDEGEIVIQLSTEGFLVRDTGCGVSETVQQHLFERFIRAEEGDSSGSGLGLSIVKRVCEHVRWSLQYKSNPSGGAQFLIHFDPSASSA